MATGRELGCKYEEEFITNSRGVKQFTCRWLPEHAEPKALMFICHGYAVECSITMRETGTRIARAGYAVYGIDYEGHGQSEGLQGYIPSFDQLVDDCWAFFNSVCEKPEHMRKARFLLGESMGGVVALLLHRGFWNGAVLVAPMCKIADAMRPPAFMINPLKFMTNIIPTWKIVPTQDIIDLAYKMPEKRKEIRENKLCYKGKPRLKTAYELLMVSMDIEKNLNQVSVPFLIVHGEDDKVTDPAVSKLLYDSAASEDKTLKMYPGMWHALTSGETPENIDLVFHDIIGWLDVRTVSGEMISEQEQKAKHEGWPHHERHHEAHHDTHEKKTM